MLIFGEKKASKEKIHAAKKSINVWNVKLDNILISELVKTKTSSKYLIEYLDKAARPLVLIMPEINGNVKIF